MLKDICAYFIFLAIFIMIAVSDAFGIQGAIWQDVTRNLKESHVKTIAFYADSSNTVFLGTDKAVYRSNNKEDNWKEVLRVKGEAKTVNFIFIDAQGKIFAATNNGLFISSDEGNTWQKIFEGMNEFQKDCLYFNKDNLRYYLGTREGLFTSENEGRTWDRLAGKIGSIEIFTIVIDYADTENIYLAASDGVYRKAANTERWERVFISSASEDEEAESDSDSDEQARIAEIRYLTQDPSDSNLLYLATDYGIYKTSDKGLSWNKFASQGLGSLDIRFILPSGEGEIFAATKEGIFEYSQDKWQEIYQGITSQDAYFLAQDTQGELWAATENGVFKLLREKTLLSKKDSEFERVLEYFKDEPTIDEIRQVAIEYAEVSPQKIKSWRRGAKYRSLLPKFDLDYDKTIWGSTSKEFSHVGPRDWGIGLSWDLADFIWNPSQKDIDVRSRLMVQLRDDILDEVTRYYFERRRLQTELFLNPPSNLKEKLETHLRLQELTAQIDALTGGYFSERLNN